MKQTILKKLLISGAAAFGILGLSTPAAFAMSSNNGYSSNGRMSYSNNNKYGSNNSYNKGHSPCYKTSSYGNSNGNNMYGGKNNRNMYMMSHKNNRCHHNSYGSKQSPIYD